MDRLIRPDRGLTIAEAKKIVDDVYNGRRLIDTQDRFHNTFFYEICPLLLIAEHVGNNETRIGFMGAKSRFDGLLLLGKKGKKQKVELTAAIDGQNDALQMELLKKRGHAPAFQKIKSTGTRRNREFGKNTTNMIRSDEYNQKTLIPLLKDALARKIKKAKRNQDYADAWLGIGFDDGICPLSGREKKKRFDPLCRQVLGNVPERYAPFSRVFFVGISRKYFFDSGRHLRRPRQGNAT